MEDATISYFVSNNPTVSKIAFHSPTSTCCDSSLGSDTTDSTPAPKKDSNAITEEKPKKNLKKFGKILPEGVVSQEKLLIAKTSTIRPRHKMLNSLQQLRLSLQGLNLNQEPQPHRQPQERRSISSTLSRPTSTHSTTTTSKNIKVVRNVLVNGQQASYTGPTDPSTGLPYGLGIFKFLEGGKTYFGQVENGQLHGNGTLFDPSGGMQRGRFENNVFCGE